MTGTATQRLDAAAVPLGGRASAAREVGALVQRPSPEKSPPRTWGLGPAGAPPTPRPAQGDRALLQPVTAGTGDPTAAARATAVPATGAATPPAACACVRLATWARGASSVSPGLPRSRALRVHTQGHTCMCTRRRAHTHTCDHTCTQRHNTRTQRHSAHTYTCAHTSAYTCMCMLGAPALPSCPQTSRGSIT